MPTTIPINRYRFFQKIQPLSILVKIANKSNTGCLQVFSPYGTWSIYLQEGNLVYASRSENIWEPLYRNLERLIWRNSNLREINEKLGNFVEQCVQNQTISHPDYLAICWLVNEQYISFVEAGTLIEKLALEFLESFFQIDQGSYEFIPQSFLDPLPKFCHLNVNSLVQTYKSGIQVSLEESGPDSQNLSPTYTIACASQNIFLLNSIRKLLNQTIFNIIDITDPDGMEVSVIRPDMIILDVATPNLSSYATVLLLRKQSSLKGIPIVLITKKNNLINRLTTRLVGATACLGKPFNQDELVKVIFENIN
ncbi:DUF4388 domain-containing protein [Cylindrospermopsis curvispora]|uniref:Response regulator n=1 Tax=Cylindrospermopsis curvispora GIHE-G1 TaxID=2666332 RepID=A0A7H0EYA1_9CYAN|nr:DUF4388 domain-containing protein [Cylindrospermopsis curvispora]QNP28767.1 response regulator [Cylindrospermopsis curvispora GIHE-G1]